MSADPTLTAFLGGQTNDAARNGDGNGSDRDKVEAHIFDYAAFRNAFPLRASRLMWLLGAGASVAAGIPTAGDMIWDFKRRIYCDRRGGTLARLPPTGDAAFRRQVQSELGSAPGFPPEGSDEEYSFYFKRLYPSDQDRQRYITEMVRGRRPAVGHRALALLAKHDLARIVWTTNFDGLPEQAIGNALGADGLTVGTPDAPQLAEQAADDERFPLVVKLHGDFRSRELKNTTDELKHQDMRLRRLLVRLCGGNGLAVVGYSGRDHSVMDALEDAVTQHTDRAFPAGLFWFARPGGKPYARVTQLIERAREIGVDAHIIPLETFDELMPDLFKQMPDATPDMLGLVDQHRTRLRGEPVPAATGSWPVIRLNALPILNVPTVCRLVECEIGGTVEVRRAVADAKANVIAARRQSGVICFGSDEDVRRAFAPHTIRRFDLHPIIPERLNFESAEHGLLTEALMVALCRERPLAALRSRRRGWMLYPDRQRPDDPRLSAMNQIERGFRGTVPGTQVGWSEAVRVRVERKLERLWLVFEPSIWIERFEEDEPNEQGGVAETSSHELTGTSREIGDTIEAIKEFVRDRHATRYNRSFLPLLDAWADLMVGPNPPKDRQERVTALGIADGIDAAFTLTRLTGFSHRGRETS